MAIFHNYISLPEGIPCIKLNPTTWCGIQLQEGGPWPARRKPRSEIMAPGNSTWQWTIPYIMEVSMGKSPGEYPIKISQKILKNLADSPTFSTNMIRWSSTLIDNPMSEDLRMDWNGLELDQTIIISYCNIKFQLSANSTRLWTILAFRYIIAINRPQLQITPCGSKHLRRGTSPSKF